MEGAVSAVQERYEEFLGRIDEVIGSELATAVSYQRPLSAWAIGSGFRFELDGVTTVARLLLERDETIRKQKELRAILRDLNAVIEEIRAVGEEEARNIRQGLFGTLLSWVGVPLTSVAVRRRSARKNAQDALEPFDMLRRFIVTSPSRSLDGIQREIDRRLSSQTDDDIGTGSPRQRPVEG